tara:strand:- start:288 stop:1268 length:981 start_codon:yes stop_codon:yes gene_type:complete
LALAECLKEANLPQQKAKAAKAKVAKGPSKAALKKAAMLDELAQLGGIAPEDDSLKSIRQAISARKKEIKAEEKAAKAAEKKEAKIKAAADKKAAKKASPKSNEYTARRLNDAQGNAILGENGSACRVKIHKENREVIKVKEDNWTDEAHARYAELFPEGKDVKKEKTPKAKVAKKIKKKISKKAKAPEPSADEKIAEEQKALIAAMVGDAAANKLEEKTQDSKPPAVEEQDSKPAAVEEEDEEEDLDELEEEEFDEDEEDTPEFPGEENIEEFEHDSLAQYEGVDFYVDENANVWDENMAFVGKYDEDEDALVIVEGYEPEDEEA